MTELFQLGDIHQANLVLLPLMSLREVVMFPRSIVPLFVGREASIKAIKNSLSHYDKKIFLVAQRTPEVEKPEPKDLFEMGTVSKILQLLQLPDGTIKVLFEGLYRARWIADIEAFRGDSEYPTVGTDQVMEQDASTTEGRAFIRVAHESLEEYSKINKKIAPETIMAINSLHDSGKLADAIMPHLRVDYFKKQAVLETIDPDKRLEDTYTCLQSEIEITQIEKRIKSRVKTQMERNQKDYYLNEQMKAISKEMGREEDLLAEVAELEEKLKAKEMPDEAREKTVRELKKLKQMPSSSAEYAVVRNYVDWILDLPWNVLKKTDINLVEAKTILDNDHYGLDKPKERILEFLAVQKLVGTMKGPILCLVGPPGVGKTSLAKSVARATGREFMRLSLGGVRDEVEIRGHRRTYVGALPGKIIQSIKRVKFNNPLFCLDEIDKMSMDFRGDPSAALLEVLDPEQNNAFNDHYLDLDYDLSKIFFITTANALHSVPLPLQDRMEIIKLPGYLEVEKRKISRQFLIPKQLGQHGLKAESLHISDNAVLDIIRRYTREAGVRNLERELAGICRKTARILVEHGELVKAIAVSKSSLSQYLGVHKYRFGEKEEEAQAGVSTGLAWTEMGGELLVVETALMPGSGRVEITGKLGDVMQESARAALSYVRSRSDLFGLKSNFYRKIDIHIHVPEGAIPKDGPSAGITLATSLVSALLSIPVRNDLAMTGEITLRGRVLPIGGVREKLLAAHRGLLTRVIIPKENAKDLKEVPEEIMKNLEIHKVEHMDEVLQLALLSEPDKIFSDREKCLPIAHSLLKDEVRPQEVGQTH
ncbi:Lon protease [Desulfovibrionales bacterium]